MRGRKLQRWGIAWGFVISGLAAVVLVTGLGPTPALARDHHEHHGPPPPPPPPQFGLNSFNGRYTTAYHGFDASITGTSSEPNPPAVPYAVSGTITADGNGNVTGGTLQTDYGSPGTGAAATCTETGTYTVTPGGQVTLNLNSSCTAVTCSLSSGSPTCASSGSASSTPTQWFCSLSDFQGRRMVCTEIGEAASGTTFQTPISAVTWSQSRPPTPPPSEDNNGDNGNGNDD